jgi:hypothetical protein
MNIETKPLAVIRAPVATRSGYGDFARYVVRHVIEYDKFDVKVHSVPWGDTPMNALSEDNPKDKMILDRIITGPINKQPDLFISITVPNEFEPHGKFNIGITAGIETTLASLKWLEGCNKMDVIFTISEHSKRVLQHSKFSYKTPTGQEGVIGLQKPIEVLHNCIEIAWCAVVVAKTAAEPIFSAVSSIAAPIFSTASELAAPVFSTAMTVSRMAWRTSRKRRQRMPAAHS